MLASVPGCDGRLDGINMSQHEVSTRETGNCNDRLRSRNGCRELLFGNGAVEYAFNG